MRKIGCPPRLSEALSSFLFFLPSLLPCLSDVPSSPHPKPLCPSSPPLRLILTLSAPSSPPLRLILTLSAPSSPPLRLFPSSISSPSLPPHRFPMKQIVLPRRKSRTTVACLFLLSLGRCSSFFPLPSLSPITTSNSIIPVLPFLRSRRLLTLPLSSWF